MTVPLAGFATIRLLRASPRAAIYEAERKRDGQRVVAKVYELIDDQAEARVEHEFRLLAQLDIEGVVRALGVERVGRQMVLLLEYVPGQNLAELAGGRPLAVADWLPLAREMATTLARIHERRIIHRDIKPSNVLVERDTGRIVFADFGISVLLEDQQRRIHEPEVLQGTLPYISPEQTGRTRREVDARSDLYSLGVTFYELLTGRPPFETTTSLELIHAHLAQRPAPLDERVPAIPAQLSAIVMKLLEKAPEHRYQSARGLAADLERLAAALAKGEREPELSSRPGDRAEFTLGEHDHASSLQLPHQLYGRERERDRLERELAATIESGSRRLLLISGPPGSGKSALARELGALIEVHRGYLGIGRFTRSSVAGRTLGGSVSRTDASGERRTEAERPYRGFVEALTEVIGQILTESDERLLGWRTRLRASLGPLLGVVGALIPELELVTGEPPPVVELELGEARNRLHLALARLVEAIADFGPLVLVLDDLQWADPGSLELLASLTIGSRLPVLFVGAYRSDEIDELHPLEILATELDSAGLPIARVRLGPLSPAALEQLLVDVLGRGDAIAGLAEVIGRKTDHNPLFVRQYLLQLAELGLVAPGERGWAWDLDAIAEAAIPDDLLGVMRAKIERLAAREREVLQVAACIGARFEFDLLAVGMAASGSSGDRQSLIAALHQLEGAGLVARSGSLFRFSHDDLLEVARDQLEPATRRRIHAALARALLERHASERRGDAVFAIVEQLDQSITGVDELDDAAREQYVRLNIEAGVRVLNSGAWGSSLGYFELANLALEDHDADAELRFEAQFGLAQAQALAGDNEAAAAGFDELLELPLSLLDYARVIARRMRILHLLERPREALDCGRVGLARCGLRIPKRISLLRLLPTVLAAWRRLEHATLEQLLTLPELRDARIEAAMLIITALKPSAIALDQNLFAYLTAVHARLVMSVGYHPTAIEGLTQIGFSALAMGKAASVVRLGDDLLELGRRRGATVTAQLNARAMVTMFIGPSGRPWREFAAGIEDGFNTAMEIGERLSAGYWAALGLWLQVEAGTHLAELRELEAKFRRKLPDLGSRETGVIFESVGRFIAQISAESEQPLEFSRPEDLGDIDVSGVTRYAMVVAEVWGRMLLGDHARARERMDTIAHDYERVMFGSWAVPRAAMLDAILVGEQARATTGLARVRLLLRLRKRLATARKWAGFCVENFGPIADVIAGELAWTLAREREAVDAFERARNAAADHGRVYVEVFACLRLAALAEQRGWTATQQGAITSAHAALTRWGAWAVVARLEREHPELVSSGRARSGAAELHPTGSSPSIRDRSSRISVVSPVSSLDLEAVLQTVQMISEDLRLEEVITRVLDSAIESAGADRGALLLERGGGVVVVADSRGGVTSAHLDQPIALRDAEQQAPTAVIRYVLRTGEPVVVDDVRSDARFNQDPYLVDSDACSLLCMPIVKQSERVGALVLENRLSARAFGEGRLETLKILLAQAASALDNARLYAQLERSEARWRSLVDGVPDIIALLDEQGRVEFVNHLEPYSRSPEQVRGLLADPFMDEPSGVAWRKAFAEAVETGERRELELCIAVPRQPRRWFMTRIVPVAIAGRGAAKVDRYLIIATDVTDRKGIEAQLRQQQRLESVGTLASGVAHEINNPVQGILNYAELIVDRVDEPQSVREFAGEITRESERVAEIVRNLLDFSRQEGEQRFEECEVRALIDATLSLIRAVLRKDQISVIVDVPEALPAIRCRPRQIQQIIMNLVANARDALNDRYPQFDDQKRVVLRAGMHERDDRRWVRISVEDRAAGIPEHLRARIFDPFFTTKGRDRGTGLGLAVSHGIAVDHGGALTVESEQGVGSTFFLDLPVDLGDA